MNDTFEETCLVPGCDREGMVPFQAATILEFGEPEYAAMTGKKA